MKIVATIAAVVALSMPIGGCAIDISKIAADLQKPSVHFDTPTAWSCDQTVKLPTSHGIHECSKCVNTSSSVQDVTVNKERIGVHPQQSVYLCPTSVVVAGHPPR